MQTKTCPQCGSLFENPTQRGKSRKYCADQCKKDHNKQWYLENKSKVLTSAKRSAEKYKDRRKNVYSREVLNQKARERYRKDRFKHLLRRQVYRTFRQIGANKSLYTEQLLGCSYAEAKRHFEEMFQEGMTWENQGEWHIDHIRPVNTFKEHELHLINHISNLRPLWAKDNLTRPKNGLDNR